MGIIIKTIRRSYSSDIRKEDDPTQLIKDFMDRKRIINYTINPDKSVDVNDDVFIFEIDLINGKIPFKFGKIDGNFNCNGINLTSLENSPKHITGDFRCIYNSLTSLENAPKKVDGNFDCAHNLLTSLEGCPKEVDGNFHCKTNQLTSLEGCPEYVGGGFYCGDNKKQFTTKEVKQYCKVKGFIWV